MLSDTMQRINESNSVEELIQATADLQVQAEEQQERAGKIAGVVVVFQVALFTLAGLLLCGGLWVRVIGERDILPRWLYGLFQRLFPPGGLLSNTIVWACAMVGLLLLPLVLASILAPLRKNVSARAEPSVIADALKLDLNGRLHWVESSMKHTQRTLFYGDCTNNATYCSIMIFLAVCVLLLIGIFRILMVYMPILFEGSGFWESALYAVIGDAAFLLLWAGSSILLFGKILQILSSYQDGLQLDQLFEEYIKAAKQLCPGYLSDNEQKIQREWEEKEAEERYRREHPVIIDYRDIEARMERNARAGGSSLTSYDHDDLDAVSRTLDRDYGGSWLDDM